MNNKHKLLNTRTLTILAMMTALAFLLAAFVRTPPLFPMPPLRFDPKDVVIVMAGFMFGPLAATLMTVVVAFLQMITVSATGAWGFLMNVISGVAFATTASFIYSKKRTMMGAIVGLASGTIAMTLVMMLWNYTLVPIFTPFVTREYVASIMLGGFLPFNLFKNTLNAALAMLLYRHMKSALQSVDLLPVDRNPKGRSRWVVTALIVSGVLAASGVIALFLFNRLWFSGA